MLAAYFFAVGRISYKEKQPCYKSRAACEMEEDELTAKQVLADTLNNGAGTHPFIAGLIRVKVIDCSARWVRAI